MTREKTEYTCNCSEKCFGNLRKISRSTYEQHKPYLLPDHTQLHHTNSPGHQEFSLEPLKEDLRVESTAERVNSARMSSQPILGDDNLPETGPEGGIDGGNVHDSEDGNNVEARFNLME